MRPYPVKFAPAILPRVWGGHRLKSQFGVTSPEPIGEYWVLSAHPQAQTVAINGELAGKTLSEIVALHPATYAGDAAQQPFPLLIKFLEAREHLSVQIHPDDEYAQQIEGDSGKTEAWYILDHGPNAHVILGHTFTDREAYRQAVATGRVTDYLTRREIGHGDLIFVPARTLHAIQAGTVLIEIQQTSDLTYRVYDWGREGRELHVERAADVMVYGEVLPEPERRTLAATEQVHHEHLLSCPYFVIEKLAVVRGEYDLTTGQVGSPDVLVVAEGEGSLCAGEDVLTLSAGDTVLIPTTCLSYQIGSPDSIVLLRTFYSYSGRPMS